MNVLEKVENKYIKTDIPDFKAGDKVKVNIKIREENKERIQTFEGIVIKIQGTGINKTFTVRKISFSVGVERTFLINSPMIASITKLNTGIVRRSKLYYLRKKIGKKSKVEFEK
jgi:large subunit ribosomal protein L19